MSVEYRNIELLKGYDPYDISCAILVLHYCLGEKSLSPRLLTRVLQLVPAGKEDAVGIPTLSNLVAFLIRQGLKPCALELVNVLFVLTNYDSVQHVIQQLREAIVVSPYHQNFLSKYERSICASSAIYQLLPKVFTDPGTDMFFVENIHIIMDSLNAYRSRFVLSPQFPEIQQELIEESYLCHKLFSHLHVDVMGISHANASLTQDVNLLPWLVVSANNFRILLDHIVQNAIENRDDSVNVSANIVKYTTLNDRTRFPEIFILEMISLKKDKDYQNTIDKIYQYFDYCQNSDASLSSPSSSANFSHICQTFILSNLYHDHGSPQVALKTLQELINTIREKSGVQGLSNLWDILIHHLLVQPDESRVFKDSIYELLRPSHDKRKLSPDVHLHWYICQLALALHENGSVPDIMELMSKINALSNYGVTKDMNRVTTEALALAWKHLGFEDIAVSFGAISPLSLSKQRKLQQIDQMIMNELFSDAIDVIETLSEDCENSDDSITWRLRLIAKKVDIMITAGNSARAHPLIKEFIDICLLTENDSELSTAIICMIKLMMVWKEYTDGMNLLKSNLHVLLQYSDTMRAEIKPLFEQLSLEVTKSTMADGDI